MEVSRLHFGISFKQVGVLGANNLAKDSVSVEDVKILVELLLFNHPTGQLVDFSLFLMFFNFKIIEKLFLLAILIDNIDEFVL